MKNIIIFTFLLVSSFNFLHGQCVPTAIVFSTQADVDAFPSLYPGCTTILGNVGITGSVTNLDSLYKIKTIKGNLSILNTSALVSLNGLANLDSIYGSFKSLNTYIQSFDSLNNLKYVGTDIEITNYGSTSIPSFQFIEKLNGKLSLQLNNTNYSQIIFPNLDSLNTLVLALGIEISPSSFGSLVKVNDGLNLGPLYEMSILPTFNSLTYVKDDIYISGTQVSVINGFNNLIGSPTMNILIQGNNLLTEMSDFNSLAKVSSLVIRNNAFLTSINGFDHSIDINQLEITNNLFLSSCDVESICFKVNITGGQIYISNNGPNCNSTSDIQASCPPYPDQDNDTVADIIDNCISVLNTDQADSDSDGIGNACDPDFDQDSDGITNQFDNCDLIANTTQADYNSDGEGDVCDTNSDSDTDGVMDASDNCISIVNPTQADINNNGIGNACEDIDNDGLNDNIDNCIFISNATQTDTNNNGIGDACEPNAHCGAGVVLLSNQSQVNNFKNQYPGCTTIDGSLAITGSVENLDSLINITKVLGSVTAVDNIPNLISLSGLNNITEIGGSLVISNSSLPHWNIFNNLNKIGANLTLDIASPSLGLSSLDTVIGELSIDLIYSSSSSFSTLNDLKYVGGNLTLTYPSFSLSSTLYMNGFQNLNKVGGNLSFNITNIAVNSLNNLTYLGGDLNIGRSNTGSTTIIGLNSLPKVKNLNVTNVLSITGLSALDTIKQNASFIGLGDIASSFSPTYFGGYISINGLNNIGGVNNLDTVRGYLEIFTTNANVVSFPTLKEVKGYLSISGNLPTFNVMNNLKKIHGNLNLYYCNFLTEIEGFQNLESLSGLLIRDNAYLSDISGLDHAITISNGSSIYIYNNPFLAICDVESICNALNSGISGLIQSNATGCNTVAEIQANCPPVPDTDGDTVNDLADNCKLVVNTNQADANNDGEGDKCDSNSDTDNDTVVDSLDNCVTLANTNQADANNDGEGDKCDTNSDTDSDGYSDNVDNCVSISNADQKDCNVNGIGDVCENFDDADCDGLMASADNCPTVFNPNQIDNNNNALGDACENFPAMGFNNSDPKTEMHLTNSNVYIDNPDKGLILRDAQGNCYKTTIVTINGQKQISLLSVVCPN
jgi:hypothetical protein